VTPELYRKVAWAFDQAAPLEPRQQAAFLQLLQEEDAEAAALVVQWFGQPDTPQALRTVHADLWTHLQVPTPDELARDWPAEIGGCAVSGELGRGGTGVVLRVHDRTFNRPLAVKLLLARPSDADQSQRFVGEAQVMGQLQHPGIPPVHALGQLDDGRPYFFMKLIEGQTLAEVLRQRPAAAADRASSGPMTLEESYRPTGEEGGEAGAASMPLSQMLTTACQSMAARRRPSGLKAMRAV
jgi:hypothetical protein